MAATMPFRLNENTKEFQAGEYTGFGIRINRDDNYIAGLEADMLAFNNLVTTTENKLRAA